MNPQPLDKRLRLLALVALTQKQVARQPVEARHAHVMQHGEHQHQPLLLAIFRQQADPLKFGALAMTVTGPFGSNSLMG